MAEAKLNREYALRVLCVGALMFGVCVWSVYDGKVAWPRINAQMETARPDLLATNMTAEAWMTYEDGATPLMRVFAKHQAQVPKKLVKKVGELRLPNRVTENRDAQRVALMKKVQEVFEAPVYSAHDLTGQTVQAVIALLLGAMALWAVLAKRGKRFVADDGSCAVCVWNVADKPVPVAIDGLGAPASVTEPEAGVVAPDTPLAPDTLRLYRFAR